MFAPAPPAINVVYERPAAWPADLTCATDQETLLIWCPGAARWEMAHEVGHLFDAEVLTDGDRRYFARLMHVGGPWSQPSGLGERDSPDEWFADYYSAAATGMRLDGSTSIRGAYALWGPKRLRRFEKALRRVGRRHGLLPYRY